MRRSKLARNFVLSPNVGARREGAQASMLILHYTGMVNAGAACAWLCNPDSKVSCHYLVDVDGAVTQMVDEDLRAWHAGESRWQDVDDVNSASIGIEIQNCGHMLGYGDFPARQMQAVIALSADILARHDIAPARVLAHSDVAPARKIDPGEKFDWGLLHRNGIGHWTPPEPVAQGPSMRAGDRGDHVRDLQGALRRYGYGIICDGDYGPETATVVAAFQRHFRQQHVDGIADRSTTATLDRLLAALDRQ
jgi:N-acetylmuramoyl-L-alanine amidase